MTRVIVLGSRGMLGHMVFRFLSGKDLDVMALDERWNPRNHVQLSQKLARLKPDVCINAIGTRESDGRGSDELFWTNGSLPGVISKALPSDCKFIHASSDAVFSSIARGCQWNAPRHPDTEYGRSKHLGELGMTRTHDWIIRCSLIGPERTSPKSLLSWFLLQQKPVQGFTNQRWNGITTLEWSQLCLDIIQGRTIGCEHIVQPGTLPPASKYSLLKCSSRIFEHPVKVIPACSDVPVRRSLIPNISCVSLEEQLTRLKAFIRVDRQGIKLPSRLKRD